MKAPNHLLIERSHDHGKTVTFYSLTGWTADKDSAKTFKDAKEALQLMADLNDYSATKGSAYSHNLTTA